LLSPAKPATLVDPYAVDGMLETSVAASLTRGRI
jgi:hypothetical protein